MRVESVAQGEQDVVEVELLFTVMTQSRPKTIQASRRNHVTAGTIGLIQSEFNARPRRGARHVRPFGPWYPGRTSAPVLCGEAGTE